MEAILVNKYMYYSWALCLEAIYVAAVCYYCITVQRIVLTKHNKSIFVHNIDSLDALRHFKTTTASCQRHFRIPNIFYLFKLGSW